MYDLSAAATLCLMLPAAYAFYWYKERTSRHGLPFPPGPKPLPLVGNLFDLPYESPWLVYDQWAKEYGQ
jgi:hypothetical protein